MVGIMGNKKSFTLHIFTSIFLGIIIYASYRGLHFIDPTERFFPLYEGQFPNWIKYNLPDGLWLYAVLATITLIWKRDLSRTFHLWLASTILLTFLTEFFQATHFIKGTFDWKDLLAYSLAIILYYLNFRHLTNNYN